MLSHFKMNSPTFTDRPELETALSRLFFKLSMRLLAACLPLLYKMSHVTWTDLSLLLRDWDRNRRYE